MVRGSSSPGQRRWQPALRAAASEGPRLNVLGQSSVAVIILSITSYHPACQAPPASLPPPWLQGKEKARERRLPASGLCPAPLAARQAGEVPGAGLLSCGLHPRARWETLPAWGWQTVWSARRQRAGAVRAWLFDSCHSHRAQGTMSSCLSLVLPPPLSISLTVAKQVSSGYKMYMLCDLEQVTQPLWVSTASSGKWR